MKIRESGVFKKSFCVIVILLGVCVFAPAQLVYASINFVSESSAVYIGETNSQLKITNANKIIGWDNQSIIKEFANKEANAWALPYPDNTVISQEGSLPPATNLVYANSNAIVYCCKNTSNAIVSLNEKVRVNSNAFVYCCKNTSNALSYGIKNNSNAIIAHDLAIRTHSNAFVYCCKNTSNALHYAFTIYDTHQVYASDTVEQNFVFFKDGFTVNAGKTLTLNVPIWLTGSINLDYTGIIDMRNDLHFGSGVTLPRGGTIKGNGFTLVMTDSLMIPANQTLRIDSDTIIDGRGNCLILPTNARLVVSDGVTLTLKNMCVVYLSGSQLDLEGSTGDLALQNVTLDLDDDFRFDGGQLHIHKDVLVRGPHVFIYESESPLTIHECSMLQFNLNGHLRFTPGGSTLHGQTRNYLRMADSSSVLYFDDATFEAPAGTGGPGGVLLKRGTVVFDNKVILSNPTLVNGSVPNTDKAKAITFGDGVDSANDVAVHVLSGARVEVRGSVDYNNTV